MVREALRAGLWAAAFAMAVQAIGGCSLPDPTSNIPGTGGIGGAGGLPTGKKAGEPCSASDPCRAGLACKPDTNTCQPAGNKIPGASCVVSAECTSGNYCALTPTGMLCAPSGTEPEGGRCSSEGDCMSGLACVLDGLYGKCAKPGTKDFGQACAATTDCLAGLLCVQQVCQPLVVALAPWRGASCPPDDTTGPPRALFDVQVAGEADSEDFYRLPFPNDIHKKNGRIDLSKHPHPPPALLPFDPVKLYLDAIGRDSTGFGTNTVTYFRLSKSPNYESLRKPGAFRVVNITKSSAEYGLDRGYGWFVDPNDHKYLCAPYIAVRQPFGDPYLPGETYAIVLNDEIVDGEGTAFGKDADFTAMLAASAPGDATLAAAWAAYQPLRDWIADKSVDATKMIATAVFTTEAVTTPLKKIREAVRAAPAAEVKSVVKCDTGVVSPCEDGLTGDEHERGCFAADPNFDEYQGTLSIPVFQKGTAPYLTEADGGGIEYAAGGTPQIARTEDVCFALTVPKGSAPANGWPLLVYAHGTGGSLRNHITAGIAADFAKGDASSPATPMATIGFDGVLHGKRRGASTKDPEELVYNFLNPAAARDNALQGGADLFAVIRAVSGGTFAGASIDATKIALWGHSQGGNAAAIATAFETGNGATVLSGTGGLLLLTFLNKTQPVNIAGVLPFVLGDPRVDDMHPVLNLLQMYFERSDPVNFGPLAPTLPRHLLHVMGANALADVAGMPKHADNYSPEPTQRAYAASARLPLRGPKVDPDTGLQEIAAPVKGNLSIDGKPITAAQVQYQPGNYDGHFVSTQNPAARNVVRVFVETFVKEGTPTIE